MPRQSDIFRSMNTQLALTHPTLACMPTPEVSWPLAPKQPGVFGTQPGGFGIGVFIMVRGKLNAPLSKSLQRAQTLFCAILPLAPSFAATAAVQLAKPAQ